LDLFGQAVYVTKLSKVEMEHLQKQELLEWVIKQIKPYGNLGIGPAEDFTRGNVFLSTNILLVSMMEEFYLL